MNKISMPLGIQLIIGAFISIVLGIVMVGIALGLELMTFQNTNQSISDSMLNGTITLSIGLGLYYFTRNVIGKFSAEFTLSVFPVIHSKIEEAIHAHSITKDEAVEKEKSLLTYTQTIHTLDGLHVIIQWGYLLIILIYMGLSFVAYDKSIDIDVEKFAIFETVTMISLYFSSMIYMYTLKQNVHKLI